MADNDNNCPSCADDPESHPAAPGSVFGTLPGNPSVFVREFVPPTEVEVEFSRNFYAALESRTGRSPNTEGILIQTQVPPESFPPAQALSRAASGERVFMPDISGLPMDPNGPAAITMRAMKREMEASPSVIGRNRFESALPGGDILMPSQFTAPWFEVAANGPRPTLPVFPYDRGMDGILRRWFFEELLAEFERLYGPIIGPVRQGSEKMADNRCTLEYQDRTILVRERRRIDGDEWEYIDKTEEGASGLIRAADRDDTKKRVEDLRLLALFDNCIIKHGFQDRNGKWAGRYVYPLGRDFPNIRDVNNALDRYVVRTYCCRGWCEPGVQCTVRDASIDVELDPRIRLPAGAVDNVVCECP